MAQTTLTVLQLKQQAYRLAGVTTTQTLKHKHAALVKLDMRRKASWVRTIEVLDNRAHGVPVWDGEPENIDETIEKLLNFQAQLVDEMCEIGLNQMAINEELEL